MIINAFPDKQHHKRKEYDTFVQTAHDFPDSDYTQNYIHTSYIVFDIKSIDNVNGYRYGNWRY